MEKTVEELFKETYGISVTDSRTSYNGSDMVKFARLYIATQQPVISDDDGWMYDLAGKLITRLKKEKGIIGNGNEMFLQLCVIESIKARLSRV